VNALFIGIGICGIVLCLICGLVRAFVWVYGRQSGVPFWTSPNNIWNPEELTPCAAKWWSASAKVELIVGPTSLAILSLAALLSH
jgi:hypothetical protein